ncbi:MAG: hypothetical protein K1V78_09475 [Muribaculaceae bacterium]
MTTFESEHPEGAGLWLTPRLRVDAGAAHRRKARRAVVVPLSLSRPRRPTTAHDIGSPSLGFVLGDAHPMKSWG